MLLAPPVSLGHMGGIRNLKLGGNEGRGKGQGTWGNEFFVVCGPDIDLINCCVHGKDVVGSRSRAPGQSQGAKPP